GDEFDLQLVELQFFLGRVDDFQADVDRVALHLAVWTQIGERHRGIAMADGDRLGLRNALHDGAVLSACNVRPNGQDGQGEHNGKCPAHFSNSRPCARPRSTASRSSIEPGMARAWRQWSRLMNFWPVCLRGKPIWVGRDG